MKKTYEVNVAMKVEDLNKSKAYKKLNMNDVEKSELLEMCKSKKKELKSDIPDLSIRRTEKMKKDNISSVFKTVAVASLSIAATGAIIAGVANYNSGKDSNNISAAKRTTEVSSEITTKSTEDVKKDAEGLQVMRNLARNMAYLLKCQAAGRQAGVPLPERERGSRTNFIR